MMYSDLPYEYWTAIRMVTPKCWKEFYLCEMLQLGNANSTLYLREMLQLGDGLVS